MREKIEKIVADALFVEAEVVGSFELEEGPEWDSMAKVALIAALDSELDVVLEYGDLDTVKAGGELVELIQSKLKTE